MSSRACSALKSDGQQYQAPKLKDSQYCRMHDPEHAEEVAETRRLGGLRRRREATVAGAYEIGTLDTVADIRRIIEIAIIDTLGLENSVARNRTLAYLAQVALKSLETGELEDRLQALEQSVIGQRALPEPAFDADPNIIEFQVEEAGS